jgi:hypothetical protein
MEAKIMKKKYGSFKAGVFLLCIITISILLLTNSVTGAIFVNKQIEQDSAIKYFEYKNDFLKYKAKIIELTKTKITLQETYFYSDGEEFNSFITSYDINSRKSLNQDSNEYYLWIWIDLNDLTDGVVHAADKTLTLVETTPEYYIFTYSDQSGCKGELYYDRSSLILQQTNDIVFYNGEWTHSKTEFVSSGYEKYEIKTLDISLRYHEDNIIPPGSPTLSTYYPPYYSKGGDKYSKAEWKCTASASWDASYITGRHYNYGEVNSGFHIPGPGAWGRGITQSWAWVKGPSGGKFSCSQSGTYKIDMSVRLNGASQVSIVNAGWLGSGSASGKNHLTGYLYDYDTGYTAGSLKKVLWEGSAVPSNFRTWNNEMTTISFNVYLYTGHKYYFKTLLYDEFRAGHILFGAGYALTGLEAKLLSVKVTKL